MSLHNDIQTAVATLIAAANLSRIATNVVTAMLADAEDREFPLIFVAIDGESEAVSDFASGMRLLEYPVKVLICDIDSRDYEDPLSELQAWRQSIIDLFPDRRIAGVPADVHGWTVTPQVIVDTNQPMYRHVVSGIKLTAKAVVATS